MTEILIIEDDISLSNGIALTLKEENRTFEKCYDIATAKKHLNTKQWSLIILDINLPDGSGLDLCREIRRFSQVPILFLTANDTEIDMVTGLESGGDDYITKPFSLAVLRARVSALIRRSEISGEKMQMEFDRFVFDFKRMVFTKNNIPVELSKTEQRLLYLLMQNQGQIMTRERLIEMVWQDGTEYVDENALSVVVRRLRSKLEDNPSAPVYIQTIYGIGYMWEAQV